MCSKTSIILATILAMAFCGSFVFPAFVVLRNAIHSDLSPGETAILVLSTLAQGILLFPLVCLAFVVIAAFSGFFMVFVDSYKCQKKKQ